VAHVDVDHVGGGFEVVIPDGGEYLLPGENLSAVAHKVLQQGELPAGELYPLVSAYGPEGQRVALGSVSSEGELRVVVGDRGPGIPETELPHIFERFYRLAEVEMLGSGLGLSIAQTIAEAHGGRIEAESHPGEGTRMSFILPLL
jgi:light-regulated signal transduction histidine kinase (bacteriophytochrome)